MWFKLASATFTNNLGTMSELSNSWPVSYNLSGGISKSSCPSFVTKNSDGTQAAADFTATFTLASGSTLNHIKAYVGGVQVGETITSGNSITIPAASITGLMTIEASATGASTGGGTTTPDTPPAEGNGALGLPTTYQAVEYLETDGTQYFVFNGEKVSSNVSYEIKFSAAKVTSPKALIGSYSSTAEAARSQIRLSYQQDSSSTAYNGLEWMYGAQGVVEKATVADAQISAEYWTGTNTLKVDANNLYWNDTLLKTYEAETFTTSQTDFTLFAQNNNNAAGNGSYARQSSVKCYSVKIKDTTNSINRELVPCYRVSDNVIGFYDTVNFEFIVPTVGTITSKGSIISA